MASWNRKWTVTSFTDTSKQYVVSEGTDIVLGKRKTVHGCSCPAWRFKKVDLFTGTRPDCKHIIATLGQIKIEKNLAIEESTRLLFDQWAVKELSFIPDIGMESMEDRSV